MWFKGCGSYINRHCFCRKNEIFIGSLNESLIPNEHSIASHAYHYDTLTWCVQMKQSISTWKNIYRVCSDKILWVLFSFSALCTDVTTFFLQQFDHQVHPKWDWFRIWFDGLRVLCGMSSTYKPETVLSSAFFMICVFVGMISYNTCNSFILLFMMIQIFEKQVNTVNQIIEQKFDMTGDNLTLQLISKRSQVIAIELSSNKRMKNYWGLIWPVVFNRITSEI